MFKGYDFDLITDSDIDDEIQNRVEERRKEQLRRIRMLDRKELAELREALKRNV
jgi:hypothetical protein